ncbi:D-amino-acid transaminase [Aquibacillus rhizosphaerae]|uniref:D-alanine aminotransferase n=1 Tax=Aquibacillus rhizosphaerae TaxID=3051431 RepID=A0ABT7L3F0_9BACI|nr:D-amino-acid transaminase [Aquibacillus sp. LR5S19]MDL4840392.1 D-amino-acid transaminase [Aquibacillus sp. LR5S19]
MTVYQNILTQSGFMDNTQLTYPFEERGLQFGDGIYEVIRIYKGSYYLLTEHVNRLFRSADALKITLPFTKEELYINLEQLIKQNNITKDAKVYLQVTRGSAARDHVFPDVEANFYAYAQDLPRPTENLRHGVAAITIPDIRWQNCYIKSLNLLPNVLAKQEAKEQGCFEAILHREETVTECSSSNVYLVKGDTIYTHPETNTILHGCVRSRIKTLLDNHSIAFRETAFNLEQLADADEVFLSSSTAEVMPIIMINNNSVKDGKPGKITQLLQKMYEQDSKIHDSIFS